jgi:hypothetical protein
MLQQAYGEDALKRSTVLKWVQRYREGRKDTTWNKRSGRCSTSRSDENIDWVHSLVLSDHRITVQMIADDFQIGKTFIYSILIKDLEIRHLCQDCAKTAYSWAKVAKKTMLHWMESLRGKGCILGESHHRWWIVDLPESTTLLKGLKEDDFQGCVNHWKRRWDKYIASEGDNSDVLNNT